MVTTMPKRSASSNPDAARHELLVFGGVDTHADTHTVAAISHLGVMLGHASFPATPQGYRQLDRWLAGHGPVLRVGVEGTGSYGAGLAAALTGRGIELVEVNRPNRATRRARGKSDPIDAEAAARAALAGVATAAPKSHSGLVEAIRVIFVARRGAVQARTAAINTLHQMIITAPMRLRDQLQPLTRRHQITTCARFHAKDLTDPARATRLALRRLRSPMRHHPDPGLLRQNQPAPAQPRRNGRPTARCTPSCSAGLRYHPETQAYATNRSAENKTDLDIRRSLKRYLARRLFALILNPNQAANNTLLAA